MEICNIRVTYDGRRTYAQATISEGAHAIGVSQMLWRQYFHTGDSACSPVHAEMVERLVTDCLVRVMRELRGAWSDDPALFESGS